MIGCASNILKEKPFVVRLILIALMCFTFMSLGCAMAALVCVTVENFKDGFNFFDFMCNVSLISVCVFLFLTELPIRSLDKLIARCFPIYSATRNGDLYSLGFTEIIMLFFILEGLSESKNTKEMLGEHYFRLYWAGGIVIGCNGVMNILAAILFFERKEGRTAKQQRFPDYWKPESISDEEKLKSCTCGYFVKRDAASFGSSASKDTDVPVMDDQRSSFYSQGSVGHGANFSHIEVLQANPNPDDDYARQPTVFSSEQRYPNTYVHSAMPHTQSTRYPIPEEYSVGAVTGTHADVATHMSMAPPFRTNPHRRNPSGVAPKFTFFGAGPSTDRSRSLNRSASVNSRGSSSGSDSSRVAYRISPKIVNVPKDR